MSPIRRLSGTVPAHPLDVVGGVGVQVVERAAAAHGRAHLVTGDAVEAADMDRLGVLLGEAFEAKRRMNPHITEGTPIEAMLSAAAEAGATGGKICGAGGGGYLLIASPPEARAAVRSALEAMGGQFAPFEIDPAGVRARRGDDRWTPSRR